MSINRRIFCNLISKPLFLLFSSLFLFFCVKLYYEYRSYDNEVYYAIKQGAHNIGHTLEELFDYAEGITEYIGRQITLSHEQDVNKIIKLIGRNQKVHDNLSWLNIGWIDGHDFYIFDRQIGLIKPAYSLAHRPYVQKCRESPGNFHTSPVVIGAHGMRKIPGGVGIIDDQLQYLGTLCIGLNLIDVNHKIQQKLTFNDSKNIILSYVVIDSDLNITLQSEDNRINIESKFYKNALEGHLDLHSEEGVFSNPIHYKNITYSFFKKTKNYPYYILCGINSHNYYQNFIVKIYQTLLELFIVILICAFYIFFKYRLIADKIKQTESSRNKFLLALAERRHAIANTIDIDQIVLLKNLEEKLDIHLDPATQIKKILKINKNLMMLHNFTDDNIQISYVDINQCIQEARVILKPVEILKESKINFIPSQDTILLYTDKLIISHVIIGLINLCLEYSTDKNMISIRAHIFKNNDEEFVEVVIEDKGYAVGREEICRLQQLNNNSPSCDPLKLQLTAIEELIDLLKGTLSIESKWEVGKKFILNVPCQSQPFISSEPKIADDATKSKLFLVPETYH